MNTILKPVAETGAFAYLDDVLIPAVDEKEGLQKLQQVLLAIRNAGMTIRLDKCNFLCKSLAYLGHEIEAGKLRPGSEKAQAVEQFPVPRNVHEVR